MSKRSLPSWMSSRDNGSKSLGKKSADDSINDCNQEDEKQEMARRPSTSMKDNAEGTGYIRKTTLADPSTTEFSKLLDGVVFVLSGFVNPERSTLRSQALEMGAEYHQDWDSSCTLLICAFPGTPKFRQVEAECGTIVSKDWITECYTQKKLVDIEIYLMHAGNPWRRGNISHLHVQDHGTSPTRKSEKERQPHLKSNASATIKALKSDPSKPMKDNFSPFKVKKWATEDLKKTISWLESQDEKPKPSEIRKVAAEGILTCLQDAIDLLHKNEDLQQLNKQWSFIPYVVEELIKIDADGNSSASFSKEDTRVQAVNCKQIYEQQLNSVRDDPIPEKDRPKNKKRGKSPVVNSGTRNANSDSAAYDSDETVEMTEEEIELAYQNISSSKLCCRS
ncbi:hypothetical protein Nepgr_016111 [Nepenthes gracilis]|uniref:BRCT domain-containing protein n=1 Tax=Nepenthes gracilis TaxID=150966 RepID=A0AAD3SM44_NEPGR|nr:hypothetical protein Nepgr_016111 [Nepenthes gracilis]